MTAFKNLVILTMGWLIPVSCKGGEATIVEAVMIPGETIVARNANGKMTIRAFSATERQYQWNGKEKTIELLPRKERWNGILGLYSPGSEIFPVTLLNRTRIVAQEAELHFESENEALAWLQRQRPMQWVYSSEGLVVGWFETPARHQINVDIYQIYISGSKPTNLPGANNEAIRVDLLKLHRGSLPPNKRRRELSLDGM